MILLKILGNIESCLKYKPGSWLVTHLLYYPSVRCKRLGLAMHGLHTVSEEIRTQASFRVPTFSGSGEFGQKRAFIGEHNLRDIRRLPFDSNPSLCWLKGANVR